MDGRDVADAPRDAGERAARRRHGLAEGGGDPLLRGRAAEPRRTPRARRAVAPVPKRCDLVPVALAGSDTGSVLETCQSFGRGGFCILRAVALRSLPRATCRSHDTLARLA